jgi:hypothetical protein
VPPLYFAVDNATCGGFTGQVGCGVAVHVTNYTNEPSGGITVYAKIFTPSLGTVSPLVLLIVPAINSIPAHAGLYKWQPISDFDVPPHLSYEITAEVEYGGIAIASGTFYPTTTC